MPMWAWIAALAGGGLAIGGIAYVASKQTAPAPALTPLQAAVLTDFERPAPGVAPPASGGGGGSNPVATATNVVNQGQSAASAASNAASAISNLTGDGSTDDSGS